MQIDAARRQELRTLAERAQEALDHTAGRHQGRGCDHSTSADFDRYAAVFAGSSGPATLLDLLDLIDDPDGGA